MNTTLAQQIANEGGVEAWMVAQQHKSLLRFLTCGSVDDGKSTLIGRLLHDTRQIYEDQLSSLHNDSKRHGTQGEKLDLALLVDGLQAEREQGITIDVANREQCREVLEQDIEAYGAWYGVVSNAGIARDAAFPALSDSDWDTVIHTNLDSFYNVIQPCIMPMIGARQGGRIITLSSVSGVMGNRGQVNYSAAKAGIIGATKALAIELAKRKITVNCIAPGLIDTGMIEMEEAALKEAMAMIPMKRMGQADEVAGLASYLMSDVASYVTRQVISINGGML